MPNMKQSKLQLKEDDKQNSTASKTKSIRFLKPIKESTTDYEAAEKKILELLKKEIFIPLLRELNLPSKILNAETSASLIDAINDGRITFSQGKFEGSFNSSVSKELKKLGAKFDKVSGSYRILQSDLPMDVRNAVSASLSRFQEKLSRVDSKLAQILPAEIAGKLSVEKSFDQALWKVDDTFSKQVKAISVSPTLTPDQRKRIAGEWGSNMKIWIQDFAKKEIESLREKIQKSAFSGDRYESLVDTIQAQYGVTADKAKFLARQETNLMMAKFKQTKYESVGVKKYKWGCVKMPHDKNPGDHQKGNVRYSHGLLEGKIFEWSNPPVTSAPGEPVRRNNPGQDYNCRCFAIPVVEFTSSDDEST